MSKDGSNQNNGDSRQSASANEWIPYVVLLAITSVVVLFLTNRGEKDVEEPADSVGGAPSRTVESTPEDAALSAVAAVAAAPHVDPAQLARGEELSKMVCATCHMYPEPGIETKFSWSMEILPRMAIWLGFSKVDLDESKGGERLLEAGIIPEQQAMSLEDWEAICNYYVHHAPAKRVPQPERPEITVGLKHFRAALPKYDRPPKTTLVKIEEGTGRIYLGNDEDDLLSLYRIDGAELATLKLPGPPVALHDTEAGLFLTVIGDFEPSDNLNGSIVFLSKPGKNDPGGKTAVLLDRLGRPTDAVFADLNDDGREDVLVPEFGYNLGQLSWFENLGNDQYRMRLLWENPGAVRALTYDFNEDGKLDIVALMGQGREGIYLFTNQGDGEFDMKPLATMHPSWGHSDMSLGDFNGDGKIDILATNGDNGDRAYYRHEFKPYHGVRIYLNDGANNFKEGWFFPQNGAYRAMARDYDGDGDLDIAVNGYFPDWVGSPAESFVYLENKGDMKFEPFTFPEAVAGKWLVMDAADLEGDGDIDIVLGAYNLGPGVVPPKIQEEWDEVNVSFVILENTLR